MPNFSDPPRKGRFDPAIEDKRLRDQFAGRAMEALLKDLKLMMALAEGAGLSVEDFIGTFEANSGTAIMSAFLSAISAG